MSCKRIPSKTHIPYFRGRVQRRWWIFKTASEQNSHFKIIYTLKKYHCTEVGSPMAYFSPQKKPKNPKQISKQENKAWLPKDQRIHERPYSFHITVAMESSHNFKLKCILLNTNFYACPSDQNPSLFKVADLKWVFPHLYFEQLNRWPGF